MQARSWDNMQGIDVSHWQGNIDWKEVQKSNIEFAYIKATEGSHYIDPLWKTNAVGASRAGLKIGFYHFARFNSTGTAITEANHFVDTIHFMENGLPLVLDLEVTSGLDKTTLSQIARVFLECVQDETSASVMLYTNTNMVQNHLTNLLEDYPLWIAHYVVDKPGSNEIWNEWHAFQYSSKGQIPGIKGFVDLDELVRVAPKSKKRHITYKIQKGDTFWALEEKSHWQHGTLLQLNPNVDPRRLQIGQVIQIPQK